MRFAAKRRGCCCNLSVDVVLKVRFTTTGCALRVTPIYMWREQAMIEWSRRVISIVAYWHCVKLCALATRASRSQHKKYSLLPCLSHAQFFALPKNPWFHSKFRGAKNINVGKKSFYIQCPLWPSLCESKWKNGFILLRIFGHLRCKFTRQMSTKPLKMQNTFPMVSYNILISLKSTYWEARKLWKILHVIND